MKMFGSSDVTPVRREKFTFRYVRDDEPESQVFTALAVTDMAALAKLFSDAENEPDQAVVGMIRLIAKLIDNSDGVKAGWKPKVLPQDEGYDGPPMFRAPYGPRKGQPVPYDELSEFQDPAVWSSRRRWLALTDDDDVILQEEDLSALFQWLVGLAANRPTERSS